MITALKDDFPFCWFLSLISHFLYDAPHRTLSGVQQSACNLQLDDYLRHLADDGKSRTFL
jgi:hypothetical protein